MKKSLLWLSAAMVFILALKAQLPELSNYFSGSTQQVAISSQKKQAKLAVSMMPNIRYVTPTGAGTKDGTSWANASDSPQDMIDASPVGAQVWVAAGTYKPTKKTDPAQDSRWRSFILKSGVEVYGGFAGTESVLAERDVAANTTILSGDFDNNDVVTGSGETLSITNQENNAYHVVVANTCSDATILDGFTVRGGNANASTINRYGGGLVAESSSLKVANCSFTGNLASENGGAAYFKGSSSDHPSMENCNIFKNSAKGGGGVNDEILVLSISGTQFTGNNAINGGGGYNREGNGSAQLSYCTFTGNYASFGGGGNDGTYTTNVVIDHCIFIGNKALTYGGGYYSGGDAPPLLTNSVFIDNEATTQGGGGYYVYYENSFTSNCIFSGNRASYGGGIYTEYYSVTYVINSTFINNTSTGYGGGGIYAYQNEILVLNCIFSGNQGTGSEADNQILLDGADANIGYNLIQGGLPTNSTDLGNNISSDPNFLNPSDPDGADDTWFTADDGLKMDICTSVAVDGGLASSNLLMTPVELIPTVDITGTLRPQGAAYDLGAYEQGTPANNTAGAASSTPTLCINTALTNITHATTGATGIANDGVSGANGLPAGVSATWASNTITISGTPTASGTFAYSVPLTGGCGSVNATGTITVNPTATLPTAIDPQVYAGTGTIADLTATGTGLTWYANATGGTALLSSQSLADGTTYYVSQGATACESARLPVTVRKISEATQTLCAPATVANLVSTPSTGTTATWFSSPTGGSALTSGTALTIGAYYVEQSSFSITTLGSGFNGPFGVAIQSDGKIVVVDRFNQAIKRMNADGTGIETLGAGFSYPCGVAIQSDGKIVVADAANGAIKRMNADGTGIVRLGPYFSYPTGVAIQSDGKIVVADLGNSTIKRMNADGTGIETLGSGFSSPPGVAIQSDGKIVVADLGNSAIKRMNAAGTGIETLGSGFSNPFGVAIQSDGKIVVADFGNSAIKRMNSDGTGIVTLGSGFLNPEVVAIQSDGKIVVADFGNSAIKRIAEGVSNRVAVNVTVTPDNTAGAGSSTPTLCINTALTNITHATTGATGIGTATGLPAGVSAAWAANVITISGTPTASGTFSYSIPLTGGCGMVNATGTITVTPDDTAGAASSTPTLCINTALTNITHATTGATGIGTATGLPAGVSASWTSDVITISGTPTASGTFSYSIPLTTGGCGPMVNATGMITVTPGNTPANTAGAASSTPTLCINTALTNITHATTGATGIGTATGLPVGVSAAWASDVITISGTPTASGTFSYSIPLTGGCGMVNATGTITVNGLYAATLSSADDTICAGTTANLTVAIYGGTAPYTVVHSGGTVNNYTSGSNIPVSPASTATYTLTSVTDANGCKASIDWKMIDAEAGSLYTVGIKADGSLWAWGRNNFGQLGDGTTVDKTSPVQIGTATNWASIAAGSNHTIAIQTDGSLWAWGANSSGQLGDGSTTNSNIPVKIGTDTDWASIAGGGSHTIATKTDGSLWAWGFNLFGRLGDGTTTDRTSPIPIGTATNWASIAAGSNHTIATQTDGTLWAWGRNNFGQLGDGTTVDKTSPVQIGTATNWASIAGGNAHTIATKTDGSLWAWGANSSGQLGDGSTTNSNIPVKIGTDTDWASIAGGSTHTIATQTDGSLWTWGFNLFGQLGDGTTTNSSSPVKIGTATWASIACGLGHTIATQTDGSLWAWGWNQFGQLGDGTTTQRNSPVQIAAARSNTITVTLDNTAGAASSTPTLCINTALTNITHATTGATGIGTATGLPAGVSAAWAANVITISGTPTASGTFSYSIPLTGGCGMVNATGTITVTPEITASIDFLNFLCKDSTIVLSSTINGATLPISSYNWTQSGAGSVQITNNNDGTATATGVNPGKVYIQFNVEDANGCAVVSNTRDSLVVLNCNNITAVNDSPSENSSNAYMIGDPCTCKGDGLFDETVWVEPTSVGEVWTVSSIAPLRAGGAAPQNIAVGNTLSYRFIPGPNIGIHEISFVHVDSSGFSVVIEGPNPLGSAGNVFLSINNECYYPDVVLDSVPVLVSPNAAPFVITGTAANSATGIGTFTLNGVSQAGASPAPTQLTITPSSLPLSLNTLEYSFDADTAGSKNLSDPGCVQTISKTFQVADCNCKDITISLDVNCRFVLTANLVSDGNCSDGTVRVMDSNPNNGNIIDCIGVFTYGLYDDFDNLICMGQVTAEGTTAPVPCNSVLSSLNVTLDGNGQFNLTPQTVAAGPCSYELYRVVVQDNNQSNGGIIDCPGTWTYGLFDTDGHLVAWGKVTAEDKTAPALVCTDFYADTLACFDVNYVLNNKLTIGSVVDDNVDPQTASPKPAATSAQTILNAEGVTGPDDAECNMNAPGLVADDVFNLGYPYFKDNCRSCGCRVTLKWSDKVVYYGCDSISATGIYARIYREWVATDCNGMRSSIVQVIPFARPEIVLADQSDSPFSTDNELKFRGSGTAGTDASVAAPNYDWVVQYTSCTPDKSLIQKVDVMPSFRSYFWNSTTKRDIYLDEAECNYSVQIKDTEFPTCGGKGLKINREIFVFDWCAGGVIDTLHVLIKITDDKAPTLTAPAFVNGAPYRNPAQLPMVEISTGPMDCTAAFPITVAGIKKTFGYTIADNCTLGNVTMSVKTRDRYVKGILVAQNTWDKVDYAIMNNSMIGLPTGVHRLIIDMSDGCYNAKRDSFEFYVYDGIAPVMKCDDQLNVSLSNGNGYTTGYAQVTVEDLNEGSWDNCKLEWIKARRNVPAALVASFIAKGYDSNNNGKLDVAVGNDINADGDYNDYINGVEEELEDGADGIDINGDGDFEDFGETFVLKGGKLMTPLTDVVEFFCGDVAAKVVVELWGSDNAYGYPGNIDGNRSFCWEEIQIEDKVAPTCVAPFDITVDCDEKCLEKIDNKAVSALCFGDVTITSGNDCAALDTVYSVSKDLKCGYGTIVRSWALTKQTAKGPITINCAQTITVRAIHQYNITFPKDASADCKTPIIDTIITDELSCDILSVNVTDKRYDASDDECYKIFRTYSVINWCTYDDVCGDPLDQTNITVIDRGYFGNYGKAPLYLLVRDSDRDLTEEFYISENLTPNEVDDYHFDTDKDINGIDAGSGFKSTLEYKEVPFCEEVDEYKHSFIYTQIIKVYDDTRPVVTGNTAKFCIRDGGDCLANLKMVINGKDNCSDKVTLETNVLMIAPYQTLDASKMIMYSSPKWSTKDLGNGDFEINVKDLAPLGVHDLIVVVRDECGNLSVPTRIPFTIADCKGPAPICINGLSTDLMSDGNGAGMMAVWASDFVASKIYDCNGQDASKGDPSGRPLITKYSLNRVGDKKDKNVTGINLTCADKGKVILVELHAWDEVGNDDFCVTYVEVQDNRKVCPGATTEGNFNIAGTISTEGTANLQGATITLSGQASMTATTTANGAYAFVNLDKGGDFTIAPQLDKNHLNGVSTFDLVLIQKHILNVVALNSPYKMIAADVNNSKSITTLDLIALRKLILNIDQTFQNNTSWRFVDATYKFPTASNPWAAAFPEVVSINDLATNTTANFVAIKVGDVNASATVSSATAAEVRTAGTLDINAAEAALKAGQEYSVEFSAADLKNVQGYQFALNLDKRKVELVDIVYGVAKAENFGVFASEGIITTSWNQAGFATATAKQGALFTLLLRAKADAQLSSALSLNRIVSAEAYNSNNDQLDLALKFNNVALSNGFELKQNTPNPFNGETLISFNLPKATAATLTISDVTGRILKSVRATYAKGLNQLTLKASDLNASGVLYYTLEADDFTATKKMIVVGE